MRTFVLALMATASFLSACYVFGQEEKKQPPQKLVFSTKNGNVTFDHTAHVMRAKGECKTCHETLFKQDSKAALNLKAGLHKPAEMDKTSCGLCHRPSGAAFESKGNCAKCHVK